VGLVTYGVTPCKCHNCSLNWTAGGAPEIQASASAAASYFSR